jgi:hypothetical protein
MSTATEQRKILTNALVDLWLSRLRDNFDDWSHIVSGWLVHGNQGYAEDDVFELAEFCANEELWEAVEAAGVDVWQVVVHAGCTNERVSSSWRTYMDAYCAMTEQYTESEREELGVDILRNGSTEY